MKAIFKKITITVFLSSAKSSSKKRFQAQLSTSPLRIVLGDRSCKKVSLWFHFSQSLMMQQRHHCWNLSQQQLVTLGTFPSQQCSGSAGSLPRSIWKSFPPGGGETVPLICVFSRKPEQVFFPHRCLCPSTSSVHHGWRWYHHQLNIRFKWHMIKFSTNSTFISKQKRAKAMLRFLSE